MQASKMRVNLHASRLNSNIVNNVQRQPLANKQLDFTRQCFSQRLSLNAIAVYLVSDAPRPTCCRLAESTLCFSHTCKKRERESYIPRRFEPLHVNYILCCIFQSKRSSFGIIQPLRASRNHCRLLQKWAELMRICSPISVPQQISSSERR